jgi:hypothetical protein
VVPFEAWQQYNVQANVAVRAGTAKIDVKG